ncbi:hypothetical protein B0T20DRAFT_499997 [Sordaria brevicollis]|uniref:Uncharacterized protein n=1 Tax=Sordaria brevicollis TaxID=83679 RepID=A0AAE0UBK8_SORBR|nr:hypothetical protein B0T20DRAFT_499997 [Sordaria brevicollis]
MAGDPLDPPLAALITAGSAGLGAATARLFAQNGIRVVINYHNNQERALKVVEDLKKISPLMEKEGQVNYAAIKADLAMRNEIGNVVNYTNEQFDNLDEEDWDTCFNLNVKSHLWLMQAAKEHLENTEGVFITTASLAGVKVSGSSRAYSVTKAAQIHLAKGLAQISAPKIRANTDWGLQFSPERQEEARQSTKAQAAANGRILCFVKCKSITGMNAIIDGGAAL